MPHRRALVPPALRAAAATALIVAGGGVAPGQSYFHAPPRPAGGFPRHPGVAAMCEDGCTAGDACVEEGCVEEGCVEEGCIEEGCIEAGCTVTGCAGRGRGVRTTSWDGPSPFGGLRRLFGCDRDRPSRIAREAALAGAYCEPPAVSPYPQRVTAAQPPIGRPSAAPPRSWTAPPVPPEAPGVPAAKTPPPPAPAPETTPPNALVPAYPPPDALAAPAYDPPPADAAPAPDASPATQPSPPILRAPDRLPPATADARALRPTPATGPRTAAVRPVGSGTSLVSAMRAPDVARPRAAVPAEPADPLDLAARHLAAGDPPAAVAVLEGAAIRRPDDGPLALALARSYEAAGRWADAAAAYKTASNAGCDARCLVRRAECLYKAGDAAAAAAEYAAAESVVRLSPVDDARFADAALRAEDPATAARALDRIARQARRPVAQVELLRGLTALKLGDRGRAAAILGAAADRWPTDPAVADAVRLTRGDDLPVIIPASRGPRQPAAAEVAEAAADRQAAPPTAEDFLWPVGVDRSAIRPVGGERPAGGWRPAAGDGAAGGS